MIDPKFNRQSAVPRRPTKSPAGALDIPFLISKIESMGHHLLINDQRLAKLEDSFYNGKVLSF
jgi:hypothetical protein